VTEIIFAVLYVSIMGLTRCYKTTVFKHLYLQFFYWILFYMCILLHKPIYGFVKTNSSRIGILLLVSIFRKLNHWRHSYDVIKVFNMAAVDVANQLPIPVLLLTCPQKASMSKCTKCRKDVSFRGWVITTSGFGKRTAAILKFYFQFQL